MKSVLSSPFVVTGASGFIGGHFVEYLKRRGQLAVCLRARFPFPCRDASLSDLPASGSIPRGAVWIHAGALRGERFLPLSAYLEANVLLTRQLLEAARILEAKRFVFLSTVGVHGWPLDLPISETSPMNPQGRYHGSKYRAELACLSAARTGLPTTIVRPAMVYGPGDRSGFLTRLIQWAAHRFVIRPGLGKNRLHFIEITDLLNGLFQAALAGRSDGTAYILAGPDPCTMETLIHWSRTALGRNPTSLPLPVVALKALGRIGDLSVRFKRPGFRLPLPTRMQVDLLTQDRYYDTARARKEIGFQPSTSVRQGIVHTIHWMKSQGLLQSFRRNQDRRLSERFPDATRGR